MIVSVSAVLLLGLLIWLLLRIRHLRWAEFLLCGAFGFLVARTPAAPAVLAALDGLAGLLNAFRF